MSTEPTKPQADAAHNKEGDAKDAGIAPPRSILEFAWAEWDLIQKKVDSVSNFPFLVKAWSVALSGFILGLGKGFDFPRPMLWIAIFIPVVFKAIESKHNAIRDTLGKRAELLERLIERMIPLRSEISKKVPASLRRTVGRLPGVALSLVAAKNKNDATTFQFVRKEGEKWNQWAYRSVRAAWHKRVVPHGDALFYLLQFVLIVLVIYGLNRSGNTNAQASLGATSITISSPSISAPSAIITVPSATVTVPSTVVNVSSATVTLPRQVVPTPVVPVATPRQSAPELESSKRKIKNR